MHYVLIHNDLKKPLRFPEVALRIYSSVSGAEFKIPSLIEFQIQPQSSQFMHQYIE